MAIISFKKTPVPGKMAKILGWISFLGLLFAMFRISSQNPVPVTLTVICAIVFIFSVIL